MSRTKERLIPLTVMEDLLKMAGAERVGKDARDTLKKVLEQYAIELGKRAVQLAAHGKRKTINAEDIKMAAGK